MRETARAAGFFGTLLLSFLIIATIGLRQAGALYTHTTTDSAYFQNGQVLQDPYGVGETGTIMYWGPVGGHDHSSLEKAGWPYTETRAVLKAAFPCIPSRYCFDHHAAALLLDSGLSWSGLDRIYEMR